MSTNKNEFKVKGEELLKKIKELIHEGNVRKIIIKNEEGKTYLEIPVTIGIVGALIAPVLAAVGAIAALAANFKIEVIKRDDQ
jgi:phage-related minor tail protein